MLTCVRPCSTMRAQPMSASCGTTKEPFQRLGQHPLKETSWAARGARPRRNTGFYIKIFIGPRVYHPVGQAAIAKAETVSVDGIICPSFLDCGRDMRERGKPCIRSRGGQTRSASPSATARSQPAVPAASARPRLWQAVNTARHLHHPHGRNAAAGEHQSRKP